MRNYVSGTLHMIRVEVQNADLALSNEKMIQNANANSSTQLILLSDDKSGFMPYRIDNFSMEVTSASRAFPDEVYSFSYFIRFC